MPNANPVTRAKVSCLWVNRLLFLVCETQRRPRADHACWQRQQWRLKLFYFRRTFMGRKPPDHGPPERHQPKSQVKMAFVAFASLATRSHVCVPCSPNDGLRRAKLPQTHARFEYFPMLPHPHNPLAVFCFCRSRQSKRCCFRLRLIALLAPNAKHRDLRVSTRNPALAKALLWLESQGTLHPTSCILRTRSAKSSEDTKIHISLFIHGQPFY